MASQVPYSPVPQVGPEDRPIPLRSADTPLASFGGAVAQAVSHLGQVEESSGNELFARGLAMQEVNQQAQANEAIANYQNKMLQSYADYSNKRGNDAVQGFQPFIDSTEKLRQDVAGNLDSDYARRMFNSESRSSMFRVNFSAAVHAKDENRKYISSSIASRIESDSNAALGNPNDEASFKASADQLPGHFDTLAAAQGWDDDTKKLKLQEATSDLYSKHYQGMAKTEPFKAWNQYEQAVKDGNIVGADVARIGDYIGRLKANVGGRNIGERTLSGADQSFGERILGTSDARAGIKSAENASYTNNHAIKLADGSTDNVLGAYQIREVNLAPWLKQAGMAPMSVKDFLNSSSAQDALFDFKFQQYQQKYGTANKAAVAWISGEGNVGTDTPYKDATREDQNSTNAPKYLQMFNAGLAKAASLGVLTSKARATADAESPNDPTVADHAASYTEQKFREEEAIRRDNERRNQDTLDGAVMNALQTTGKPPANTDELKHSSPEAETAYNSLDQKDQLAWGARITRYNEAATKQTSAAVMNEVMGLRNGNEEDRKKFLELNPYELKLSQPDMRHVISMQRDVAKGQNDDPYINRSLSVIQTQIDAAGVDRKDKPMMARLRGAMVNALYDWKEQNKGKEPDRDTVKQIGATLLQNVYTDSGIFGTGIWRGSGPLFNIELSDEAKEKAMVDTPNPSKADIDRWREVYVANRFQELQKAKSGAR